MGETTSSGSSAGPQNATEAAPLNYRIGPLSIVQPGARIGADCEIASHCFVAGNAEIGRGVSVGSGVRFCENVIVGDGVRIGANVAFDDGTPPDGRNGDARQTIVHRQASIGANAVILRGVTIGEGAVVAPGSAVIRAVPDHAIVAGNPAQITGYVQSLANPLDAIPKEEQVPPQKRPAIVATPVKDVTIHYLPDIHDMRGDLTVGNFLTDIPFVPKRYFIVHDVPSREVRGEHAHHTLHEFLICVSGSCAVMVDDGKNRMEVSLNSLSKGLYLPPMVWRVHYKYSANAILMVFASEYYEAGDYIRSYADFLSKKGA